MRLHDTIATILSAAAFAFAVGMAAEYRGWFDFGIAALFACVFLMNLTKAICDAIRETKP